MPPLRSHRLVTLGRLALLAPDGTADESLHKRRRKLAVLATLAVERRPMSRDVLLEMFWGGIEEDRARHSLSDALSHLRRVLGRDAITLSSTEVALDPEVLDVDVEALAKAARAKDHERVIALYQGPFLEGVYIADAPSFEQWADRQRRRYADLFLQSCAQHCAVLARARRWQECADVALRWLDVAPLSADAALFRLNALKAPGTSEADHQALAEYSRIATRLRREYDTEPDRSVAQLASTIAERVARTPAAPAPTAPAPAPAPTAAPLVTLTPVPAPIEPEPERAAPARQRRRRWILAGAGAAVVVVALIVGASMRGRAATPPGPSVVAVLPFAVRGGSDAAYLSDGMIDLLSTNLDGAGTLRSVDPRAVIGLAHRQGDPHAGPDEGRRLAQRLGAGLVVLGDVVASGDRLRISAALYDQRAGGPALSRGAVEGRATDLFTMVDALTRQLLAGYPDRSADRLTDLAARTTTSLPAIKHYLQGVSLYRRASYHEALDAFEQAATEDTTFALAHYQLSNAALWSAEGTWDSIVHSGQRALRYSNRLTHRARLLVEAHYAFRTGDLDRAEQLYRQTVTSYPDDVEGWYQLGDLLFHGNPARGRSMTESRGPFEHLLFLEPTHRGAMIHLLRVAMLEGRGDEARRLIALAMELTQASERPELEALRAALDADESERRAALTALTGAPDEIVRVTAMRVALFTSDVNYAARISRLLLAATRGPEFRLVGRFQLADLALARGRPHDALAQLDSASREPSPVAPGIAAEYRAIHLLLPFVPADSAAVRAARSSLRGAPPPRSGFPMFAIYDDVRPALRQYLDGSLALRLGEVRPAERAADSLESARGSEEVRGFAMELAASLRAQLLRRRERHAAAVETFAAGRRPVPEGLLDGWVGDQALERWLRAESLRALGRDEEAYAWYASLGQTALNQAVYLAPAALAMAGLDVAHGRRDAAIAHYKRGIELWKDCEPELRPVLDDARARLAALDRG